MRQRKPHECQGAYQIKHLVQSIFQHSASPLSPMWVQRSPFALESPCPCPPTICHDITCPYEESKKKRRNVTHQYTPIPINYHPCQYTHPLRSKCLVKTGRDESSIKGQNLKSDLVQSPVKYHLVASFSSFPPILLVMLRKTQKVTSTKQLLSLMPKCCNKFV